MKHSTNDWYCSCKDCRENGEKKDVFFIDKNGKKMLLLEQFWVADTLIKRMKGLLGKKELPWGSGLLILPCRSIHMIGMQFPIDAIYLDRDGIVLKVSANLQPGQIDKPVPKAYAVLEVPANTFVWDPTGGKVVF